ncbi:uncharacterized protein LOC18439188 isoform X2 [Amborella trichopoda]|nr:uncharacterized protein LOC18439188 isoform X2 [Amborella trichopoda]XP_011625236.1 uncharacterized protein LOC18439188 isoform X2 [Amborella trichopoda]|eukprot:XP_006849424.2 uncharacterized protein LOC18439188 isoform X2 [Amborella trichopoda]
MEEASLSADPPTVRDESRSLPASNQGLDNTVMESTINQGVTSTENSVGSENGDMSGKMIVGVESLSENAQNETERLENVDPNLIMEHGTEGAHESESLVNINPNVVVKLCPEGAKESEKLANVNPNVVMELDSRAANESQSLATNDPNLVMELNVGFANGCRSLANVDPNEVMEIDSDSAGKEIVVNVNPIPLGSVDKPYIGMVFDSEEAAREFYDAYARHVGFISRASKTARSMRDGTFIRRDLVCSKEGFRAQKYQAKLRPRPQTREGCKAMVRVKKEGSKWILTRFIEEHNHPLGNARKLDPMRPLDPMKGKMVADVDSSYVGNSLDEPGRLENVDAPAVMELCSGRANEEMAVDVNPPDENADEPKVGMLFESEAAAKEFYNAYARQMGFSTRSSKTIRSMRDGRFIRRDFVCSKEGFRSSKNPATLRPRAQTREGCNAMIRVKREGNKWLLTKFIKEHNHAMVPQGKVHLLRSHRRSSGMMRSPMLTLDDPSATPFSANRIEIHPSWDPIQTTRYNELCNLAVKCATEGAVNELVYNFAMKTLRKAQEDISFVRKNIGSPTQATSRSKPVSEDQAKKKRQCLTCRDFGHDQRNCPNKGNVGVVLTTNGSLDMNQPFAYPDTQTVRPSPFAAI